MKISQIEVTDKDITKLRNFFVGLFIGGLIGSIILLSLSPYNIDYTSYIMSIGFTGGALIAGIAGFIAYYAAPEHFKNMVLKRKQKEAERKAKKQK